MTALGRAARHPALSRTNQGSGRFWRGMLTETLSLGIAARSEQPDRDGADFDHAGGRRRVKRGDHADRHQRALVAIHWRRCVRTTGHVGGHLDCRHWRRLGSVLGRVRRRRKRREHEPCDQKDRQQPAKVGRDVHARVLSRSGRNGNLGWITNSPEYGMNRSKSLTDQSRRAMKSFKAGGDFARRGCQRRLRSSMTIALCVPTRSKIIT